jgi:hypothetical protein
MNGTLSYSSFTEISITFFTTPEKKMTDSNTNFKKSLGLQQCKKTFYDLFLAWGDT